MRTTSTFQGGVGWRSGGGLRVTDLITRKRRHSILACPGRDMPVPFYGATGSFHFSHSNLQCQPFIWLMTLWRLLRQKPQKGSQRGGGAEKDVGGGAVGRGCEGERETQHA